MTTTGHGKKLRVFIVLGIVLACHSLSYASSSSSFQSSLLRKEGARRYVADLIPCQAERLPFSIPLPSFPSSDNALAQAGHSSSYVSSSSSNSGSGSGAKEEGSGKDWAWRRASLAELAGITIAAAGTLYSEEANGKPRGATWSSQNGFDESIRNPMRLRRNTARDVAADLGDALMGTLIAEPIIDSFAILGYRERRWDALWQTSVMNLESFSFTALVSSVVQTTTRRQKPFLRDCPDGSCANEEPNRGMPSGHVAFAFTGAGLYCTHHEYQRYYDPATARAICNTSLAAAAADGVLRIMAERHYATDVIAGSAIGLFSGFLLPRLLHYWWIDEAGRDVPENSNQKVKRISFMPQVLDGGGGLSCAIAF